MVDTETGEVACYCAWDLFVKEQGVGEEEARCEGGKGEVRDFVEEWPEDAYVEAIRSLTEKGKRIREKWMGGEDYARAYNFLC